MFCLLRKLGIAVYIVRIYIFWYTTKNMCIGKYHVQPFSFNNGVSQGRIPSCVFVCVYMDDLS